MSLFINVCQPPISRHWGLTGHQKVGGVSSRNLPNNPNTDLLQYLMILDQSSTSCPHAALTVRRYCSGSGPQPLRQGKASDSKYIPCPLTGRIHCSDLKPSVTYSTYDASTYFSFWQGWRRWVRVRRLKMFGCQL
jgi:hypothetical protein